MSKTLLKDDYNGAYHIHQGNPEADISNMCKLFLQRRLDEATFLLLPYIQQQEQFQNKSIIWILYLRIATEKDTSTCYDDTAEWKLCIQGFNGVGYIPADVLVIGILLLMRRGHYQDARDAFEAWLSLQDDPFFQIIQANPTGIEAINYERLVELYVLHILPNLGDWTSSQEYLFYNDTLNLTKREALLKNVNLLKIESNDKKADSPLQKPSQTYPEITTIQHTLATPPPSSAAFIFETSSAAILDENINSITASTRPPASLNRPNLSGSDISYSSKQHSSKTPRISATFQFFMFLLPIIGITGMIVTLLLREPAKSRLKAFLSSGPGLILVMIWNKVYQTAKMGMNVQTF